MAERITFEENAAGVRVQEWDDATRTYYWRADDGTVLDQRAYTPEENAAADAALVQATQETNRRTIEQALADTLATIDADVLSLNNATATTADLAKAVKVLGRAQRRTIRLLIRRLDGTT